MCRPSGALRACFGLRVRDHAVGLHLARAPGCAGERALRIQDGRKRDRPLGQTGQQRRFSQSQIFGVL